MGSCSALNLRSGAPVPWRGSARAFDASVTHFSYFHSFTAGNGYLAVQHIWRHPTTCVTVRSPCTRTRQCAIIQCVGAVGLPPPPTTAWDTIWSPWVSWVGPGWVHEPYMYAVLAKPKALGKGEHSSKLQRHVRNKPNIPNNNIILIAIIL